MNIKAYILERLKEASTWRGIVLLLAAAGAKIAPEQAEALIGLGIAVAGAIAVLFSDGKKEA